MYYVLNGNTINVNKTYDNVFFDQLKDIFYFPYKILHGLYNKNIVKDMETEDTLEDQKLFDALLLQDYDIQNYIWAMLDSFLSVTDVPDVVCGTASDKYFIENEYYQGDQYSFAELAYENEWYVISLENVSVENMVYKIIKNDLYNKTIYTICDLIQLYLAKAINDKRFLGKFFTSFDQVYCVRNCSFNDWESISEVDRLKILTTFYTEIKHVLHNEFDKLGHFHGRNANRVEKINDNLFEYRVSNPNYRIYYTRKNNNLGIILTMLKKCGRISKNTMNNLMRLKNNEPENNY